jgi:hypothetical protein
MENIGLKVQLLPAVSVALESTMIREGISADDVVNRAITQYAASGTVPFDRAVVIEAMDGSTIYITRAPAR